MPTSWLPALGNVRAACRGVTRVLDRLRDHWLLQWMLPGCYTRAQAPAARWWDDVRHKFAHHLPSVLILVAIAGLIHHHHWLEAVTAQTMRVVHIAASSRAFLWLSTHAGPDEESAAIAATNLLSVTVLRFSPTGFAKEFCGITPVSRAKMARVIEHMAQKLPERTSDAKLPVVGIDADITALDDIGVLGAHAGCVEASTAKGAGATGVPSADELMVKAVRNLAKRATVIAVAFPRLDPSSRATRNESMSRLCQAGANFATARAFLDPGEPFYRFPDKRDLDDFALCPA